jgi:hypothetical protein
MRMSFRFGLAALAAAALLGTAQDARALYAPQLVGGSPTVEGANYRWTYNLVWGTSGNPLFLITAGTGANAGVLSPGTVGSQDFVTLYDIQGYVPGSVAVSGAGVNHAALTPLVFTGITGPGTLPEDLPTLVNLTFRYTGANLNVDQTFGTVSFLSTIGTSYELGFYTSQYTNSGVANSKVGEIGRVTLPAIIPEPSSVALIGMGVAGLFGYGYRRRRQG